MEKLCVTKSFHAVHVEELEDLRVTNHIRMWKTSNA